MENSDIHVIIAKSNIVSKMKAFNIFARLCKNLEGRSCECIGGMRELAECSTDLLFDVNLRLPCIAPAFSIQCSYVDEYLNLFA